MNWLVELGMRFFCPNDKKKLGVVVGTFLCDGKVYLRVYNPLDGPTLCMCQNSNDKECFSKKGSHKHPFDVSFTKPTLNTIFHKDMQIEVLGWTLRSMLTLVSRGKTDPSENYLFLNKLMSSGNLHPSTGMNSYGYPP